MCVASQSPRTAAVAGEPSHKAILGNSEGRVSSFFSWMWLYTEILSTRNLPFVIGFHGWYGLPTLAYAVWLAHGWREGVAMFLSWFWFAMLALTTNHRFF